MRPLGGATGTDTGGDSMDATRSVIKEAVLQELGERLRDLRKSRKLRQLDMESLGLSYNIINGSNPDRSIPP